LNNNRAPKIFLSFGGKRLQLKMKMRRQLIERPQLNLNQRQRLLVLNVAVVFVASCSFARGKQQTKKTTKYPLLGTRLRLYMDFICLY